MEMNSGGENRPFDIFNNSDDYILSNIETIYPLLLRHFSDSTDDSVTGRVLDIAFGPCLTLFTPGDLEEKILKYACRYAEKYFIETLKSIESYNLDNSVDNVKNLLHLCQEILSHLSSTIEYILAEPSALDLKKVKSLLLCTSVTLLESYEFCVKFGECAASKFKTLTEVMPLFMKKAQVLQYQWFQLFSKIEVNIDTELDVLNEVLTITYKSGMILLNLDVKTMADVWKAYICFVGKYSELIKSHHDVAIPIESLAVNLVNNLESYISGDICNSQELDKTVKIFCFILKVIIKLVEKFSCFLERCHKSLLYLLITLNRFNEPHYKILNLPVDNAGHFKQLVIGTDPLLTHLLNDEKFAQECGVESKIMNLNQGKRFGFILLSVQIMTKLTLADTKTRKKWFNSDNNILDWIFHILLSCNFELSLDLKFPRVLIPGKTKSLTDCYEYLLTHISAFLLMSTSKEFVLVEKTLLKCILQSNPWCSLLAIDIWCLLARFADADLCFKQFKCLCRLLIQFEKWPSIPEKLFLESTVGRLFPIMSQKHRDSSVELYPPEKYPYLWQIFGVRYLSPHYVDTLKSSLHHLALVQTSKFLSDENLEGPDFAKMESALCTLDTECNDVSDCKNLEHNLVKLWKIDSAKLVVNPLGRRYLKSLCAATSSALACMTSKNMLSILQDMKVSLLFLAPSCMLYTIDNLDQLGTVVVPQGNLQVTVLKLISSLFKQFLTDANVFVRTRSTEIFLNFASVTCHTQIITEAYNSDRALQTRITNFLQKKHEPTERDWVITNYLVKIEHMKYKHFCDVSSELKLLDSGIDEPPYKKINLDEAALEIAELEDLVSLLKSKALKISENSYKLTLTQKRELSFVCDLLLELVS